MAELLGAVTKVTSTFLEINHISIDNWGFKLFYKASTSILVFCSIIVTARQFFGSPIQCDAGSSASGVEKDVLDSYCWMYSTWNVPPQYKGACSAGGELQGISVTEWNTSRTSIVYNSYYQWVPLYLVFLAVLFYIPRALWLMMEGGLMKFFGKGTTTRVIEDQEEKEEALVKFFCKNVHNKYNVYFFGFIGCEVLNIIIVLIQFALSDKFLHGRYLGYGPAVWSYYALPEEAQRETKNPMCWTFPRIASCDYWRWGAGGKQENINAICVLALNMINDKVFLILWWWFLLISVVGIMRLMYRVVQTQYSPLRYHLINMRMNRYFKRSSKIEAIEAYIKQCKLGDWFVLYQLSKNLNRPFFMDFLSHLSVRYAHEHVDEESADDQPLLKTMNNYLHPSESKAPLCKEEECGDTGDNLIEMLLQPSLTEPDGKDKKDKKDKKDDDDDEDDEDKSDEDEEKEKKKDKKSDKKEKKDDEREIDLPDDIDGGLFGNGERRQDKKEPKLEPKAQKVSARRMVSSIKK